MQIFLLKKVDFFYFFTDLRFFQVKKSSIFTDKAIELIAYNELIIFDC